MLNLYITDVKSERKKMINRLYLHNTEFNLRKIRINKIDLLFFRFKKGGDKGERK